MANGPGDVGIVVTPDEITIDEEFERAVETAEFWADFEREEKLLDSINRGSGSSN